MSYLVLILGLATLIIGGEFLVRGAVGIAQKLKLSSLVIGMTVVSFGTSAPELIVSIKAALYGNSEIALGNVIGSNIANIALVLGITVLIFPLPVDRNSKIIDWPMMLFASVLFYVFAMTGTGSTETGGLIERYEGIILFVLLLAFITFLIRNSRKHTARLMEEDEAVVIPTSRQFIQAILFLAIGLVGLYFGAEWLLKGAVEIALDWGMEERIIGITIIAFGTSVPELVTSAVAAYRKETDISIGNLIGSNIFNIMAVIGITAIVKPIDVTENTLNIDMIWMLAIALALLPMLVIGKKITRFKGLLLLGSYIAYIAVLLLSQSPQ
ncbi:calcium/sodium antiporter [Wandonia haliotis]|uniref:Calcium/sodium antiporter n=1 Tax=Wandonia haliotis TaxID=574963 RepID=A0ABN1MS30_9FLAO